MEQQEGDEFWSPPGFGRDRRRFKFELPVEARLFRKYSSLPEALRAIPVLTPRKSVSGKDHRVFLALLVRELLNALGEWPYDYEAARKKLARRTGALRTTSAHPDLPQFAREADTLIPRLIALYEDPRKFFNEDAPEIYGFDFTPSVQSSMLRAGLLLSHSPDVPFSAILVAEGLGRLLRTWGCAALLSRHVWRAFDSAPTEVLLEALAVAEGRKVHSRGPGKGKTKGKPKKRRVDHAERRAVYWSVANLLEGRGTEEERSLLERKNLLTVVIATIRKNGEPFTKSEANQIAIQLTAQHFQRSTSTIEKSVTRSRKK